jgi:pyruvate dehydrogenase E1 component beta subunit
MMRPKTFIEAARLELTELMQEDASIVVLGEDVADGGPFGLTKGLIRSAGEARVRNTPISENAVVGVGVGLALGGARPVVDLMFNDFLTLCSDQLFNHAAKIGYMSGGRYGVPLTIWTVAGGGLGWGAQHSQRLDGWIMQVPGMRLLVPSTPSAVGSSLRAALSCADPVVVMADRSLLYSTAELQFDRLDPWKPRFVARGSSITIATTGRLVHLALAVAGADEIDADIIDLQCLAPFDVEIAAESAARTGRVLVIHDEAEGLGAAEYISSQIYREAFGRLKAPIRVLTSPPTPVPAGLLRESEYRITEGQIVDAARSLLRE